MQDFEGFFSELRFSWFDWKNMNLCNIKDILMIYVLSKDTQQITIDSLL